MNDKESRSQIYEYLDHNGLKLTRPIRESLSKLLKTYGKVERKVVLDKLEVRLNQSIASGENKIANDDPAKFAYRNQLIALDAINKWVSQEKKHYKV